MKILIAVDGSDASFEAVRQAAHLSTPERDQAAFYYSPPQIRFHEADQNVASAQARVRDTLGKAIFESASLLLPEAMRKSLHTILGEQSPRYGVLAAADQWRADMIALGARGSGPMADVPLGSVATYVARTARIPVLVARPRTPEQASAPWRVLMATDGSIVRTHTGEFVRQLTWPPGSQGWLLTIVESILPGEIPPWLAAQARDPEIVQLTAVWEREQEADRDRTRQELSQFAQSLPEPFRVHQPLVLEGHPTARILESAARERIDLIVVGASGKNTFQRLLMGSTSEAVLTRASCSVLIVRNQPRP